MCECLTNNFERRCHGKWKLVAARSSCTYVSSGIWQLHITQLQVTLTDHLYPATRSYIITCNIVEFIRISLQFSTLKIHIYQQLSFTAILKSFTLGCPWTFHECYYHYWLYLCAWYQSLHRNSKLITKIVLIIRREHVDTSKYLDWTWTHWTLNGEKN